MNVYGLYRRGLITLAMTMILASFAFRASAQAPAPDRVYRIIVMDNLANDQAQEVKKLMESWSFLPVTIQPIGDKFRVIYGEFDNHAAAIRAKQQLEQEGIYNGDIITEQKAGAAATTESYTVVVQEYSDRGLALELREKLERQGFGGATIRRDDQGNRIFYQVTVGVYSSINDAQGTLSEFFRQGYQTARVQPIRGQAEAAVKPAPTATPKAVPAQPAPQQAAQSTLAPLITQSDIWKGLSDEQRRQVLVQLKMEEELRSGNTMAAKVIDIDKRLQNLSDQVRGEIERIHEQQNQDQKSREQLSELYKQVQNHIRAGKEQEAIVVLKQIAEKDPENRFGWRTHAQNQIDLLERQMRGEMYPGQKEEIEARYTTLKAKADSLSSSQDPDTLAKAIDVWSQIEMLDSRYKEDATRQISQLQTKLNGMTSARDQVAKKAAAQDRMIKTGLAAAIGLTIIMLVLVWRRGHKRHQELMRKVQEITSIRPMRELGTNETPLLGSGSGKAASEPDIFTPRTPSAAPAFDDSMANAGDPLAAMAPAAEPAKPEAPAKKSLFGGFKKKKGKEEPAAEPAPAAAAAPAMDDMDALFGGSSETKKSEPNPFEPEPEPAPAAAAAPKAVSDDFSLDDIFGGATSKAESQAAFSPEPEPAPAMAASPAASAPAEDDPFASLFSDSSPSAAPAKAEAPAAAEDPAATSATDNTDLLSIFDEVVGGSIDSDADQTKPAEGGDDPFSALMSDSSAPPKSHDDETEIPGIKLDEVQDSPFNFDMNKIGLDSAQTQDLPAFDPGTASVAFSGNGSKGITLDFEEDALGQPPQGWEGQYDYAGLTVEADTPCKNGNQYIRFQKREGNGKAHYRYKFANMTGVIAIEFDMCCNDKNKFLLGFYVERDGDFQQSIHTKILRSEAQTTPTIHMQGEAAPYLLGSWAHIKYVVDLNDGRINGYIDSTHVVRDLPLNPNPQMLNTLSIRDNINTTGDLMLDNIKVYQAS